MNADFTGDLRIAFVSCNGQEENDRKRPQDERNAMWRRLRIEHENQPFQLLLQGGDQIYADELLNSHPALKCWTSGGRLRQADATAVPDLAETLRDGFFELYLDILGQPAISGLLARFGSAPLPGHAIRLHGLPGKRAPYTAERNYLVLERKGAGWTASWELEQSGRTPELEI